jgi:hypothetical protein
LQPVLNPNYFIYNTLQTKIDAFTLIAKELRLDFPNLTLYEALTLAVQIQRNNILENGLAVSRTDKTPPALEAIAMSLGYSNQQGSPTITEVVKHFIDNK